MRRIHTPYTVTVLHTKHTGIHTLNVDTPNSKDERDAFVVDRRDFE